MTFDVGRDDGLGSQRNPLRVTLYEDLAVDKLFFSEESFGLNSLLITGQDPVGDLCSRSCGGSSY